MSGIDERVIEDLVAYAKQRGLTDWVLELAAGTAGRILRKQSVRPNLSVTDALHEMNKEFDAYEWRGPVYVSTPTPPRPSHPPEAHPECASSPEPSADPETPKP